MPPQQKFWQRRCDRQSLRDTLDVCIDQLDYAYHPDDALVNITTGKITQLDVNADIPSSLDIGQWKTSRVDGRIQYTYCPLGKLVVTMDVKKNHMLVGRNVSMNVSMTRNSSTHVSFVYLQAHERSTSMMCRPLS